MGLLMTWVARSVVSNLLVLPCTQAAYTDTDITITSHIFHPADRLNYTVFSLYRSFVYQSVESLIHTPHDIVFN